MLWESSKNQFGRPNLKKKKVVKILENFLKIRPPLEKILDPPLSKSQSSFVLLCTVQTKKNTHLPDYTVIYPKSSPF